MGKPLFATRRQHHIGLALMLVSACVYSTAGLFTKAIQADAWTIIFWRGLFAALFTTAFVAIRGRATFEFVQMGRYGLLVALVGASAGASLIPAYKLTTVANVSLIYAAAPFLAACIAWIWGREKIERRVAAAALLAMLGVGLIVWGSLGEVHLQGDLLAFWMTLMLSAGMVIYRRNPLTPAAGPSVLASFLLMGASLLLADPLAVRLTDILPMAAFGLTFAIASITMSEGARRLAPGEAALVASIETPMAIGLGCLILGEVLKFNVMVGGGLVLFAILGAQLVVFRSKTK